MTRVGRDGAAAGRPLCRWTSGSHPRGRGASGTPGSPDGHVLRRAFERRAVAIQQESPFRTAGSLPGPDSAQASAAPLAATAGRPFRRLTPAKLLERRRQGLCFNCDEPYTPGHACPRLFYPEVADYIPEDVAATDLAAPAVAKVFDAG